ncbi:MAG: TlpA disulfide reductase family protein [Actinomycetota bacterium]|nr:TlpA disulfide reductase family protein [Actinomycetota bacterium]
MANRQRAEARRKAQAKASRNGGDSKGFLIWAILGAVVVLVGAIVFIATSGDDPAAAPVTTDSSGATVTTVALPVSQPVTITGEPLPSFSSTEGDLAVGSTAPALTGLDFQGNEITIEPGTDGPYMVVFLAHWCPHCNDEVPVLNTWKLSGAVPVDLQVIGVATAVAETAANYPPAEWFSTVGWTWPVLVDESQGEGEAGKAAVAYGATGWPYFVIVGADGKVKARYSGEISANELTQIVDTALAS